MNGSGHRIFDLKYIIYIVILPQYNLLYLKLKDLHRTEENMYNHRIKSIPGNGILSSCLACICISCMILLVLEIEGIGSRLIWIPRIKDNGEDSAEYYNAIKSANHETVRI